jgi:hypothetical protein
MQEERSRRQGSFANEYRAVLFCRPGALFYWVSLRKLGVRPAGVWLLRCAQEWGLSPGGRALHCSETALTLFAVKRKLVEMLV